MMSANVSNGSLQNRRSDVQGRLAADSLQQAKRFSPVKLPRSRRFRDHPQGSCGLVSEVFSYVAGGLVIADKQVGAKLLRLSERRDFARVKLLASNGQGEVESHPFDIFNNVPINLRSHAGAVLLCFPRYGFRDEELSKSPQQIDRTEFVEVDDWAGIKNANAPVRHGALGFASTPKGYRPRRVPRRSPVGILSTLANRPSLAEAGSRILSTTPRTAPGGAPAFLPSFSRAWPYATSALLAPQRFRPSA